MPEPGDHFMVSKDADDITVVTEEKNLKDLEIIERNKENYKLIALNVAAPFYSVGFLATVTSAIAKEGMLLMRQDGMVKSLKGLTTVEEVIRVTKD